MNARERRKFNRHWKYQVPIDIPQPYANYDKQYDLMTAWLNEHVGSENWKDNEFPVTTFLFHDEKHAMLFTLRWA